MTKLLVAKIRDRDGEEYTVKTYANDSCPVWLALLGTIPLGSKIISHEWLDTLTDGRKKWNEENPDCPITLDS